MGRIFLGSYLEVILPTLVLHFYHFQENFPPTLLFGPTFLLIFKKLSSYTCIRNSRVSKLEAGGAYSPLMLPRPYYSPHSLNLTFIGFTNFI